MTRIADIARSAMGLLSNKEHTTMANKTELDTDVSFIPLSQMEQDDEADDFELRSNSVVAPTFKARYRDRAAAMLRKPKGVAKKALARSCSDWLAIELAKRTLDDKQHLKVAEFEAILTANGVKHEHWNRTTNGWQGRLRMTGRLSLQRKVAENDGELVIPGEGTLKAPRTWVEKTLR